ncbi:uncharacterized protein [Eurosta solidaginis]|uniref:uncharacterized protein n=1 Tax=Eurosta solidaginis TaxID=178769 RepID=UPI0035309601
MEFNKRSRTTNREQFSLMVERMKLNKDIAKNISKQPPDVLSVFWTSLGTDLNALGPPTKSIAEWKKVWSDFKSSIKKKMSHNRTQMLPWKRKLRSWYVLNLPRHIERGASETFLSVAVNNAETGIAGSEENGNQNTPAASSSQPQQRTPRRRSQMTLLKTQIDLQKKFHDNVSSAMRSQKRKMEDLTKSIKNIEKSISSLNRNTEQICSVLTDLVAETKRHNLAIEKLLRDKTLVKGQLLQLELERVNSALLKPSLPHPSMHPLPPSLQ